MVNGALLQNPEEYEGVLHLSTQLWINTLKSVCGLKGHIQAPI